LALLWPSFLGIRPVRLMVAPALFIGSILISCFLENKIEKHTCMLLQHIVLIINVFLNQRHYLQKLLYLSVLLMATLVMRECISKDFNTI